MDELSLDMQAIQQEFQGALGENAGFMYPYRLTPSPGVAFQGNVWAADPRGRAFAQAIRTTPELAEADVRFLTVVPGGAAPGTGAVMPFQGGLLTLHHWAMTDPVSGETIAACSWSP